MLLLLLLLYCSVLVSQGLTGTIASNLNTFTALSVL
jgi:hypothetical protein